MCVSGGGGVDLICPAERYAKAPNPYYQGLCTNIRTILFSPVAPSQVTKGDLWLCCPVGKKYQKCEAPEPQTEMVVMSTPEGSRNGAVRAHVRLQTPPEAEDPSPVNDDG
eukprot:Sspe_Gene.61930::Locus_34519_Transcript_2_5_Confidence_0.545_Length_425::g.61930::m.61930